MKIIYQGREVGLPKTTKKVIDMFGDNIRISPKHVIGCKVNNEIKSLEYKIQEGDTVELLDLTSKDGLDIYIRGILYIMSMAFEKLYPRKQITVNYQLTNCMFCQLDGYQEVTEEMIEKVKEKMQKIIDKDLPIEKVSMSKRQAEKFYKEHDKKYGILQVDNDNKERVSLYYCKDYYNYFYGVMPLSTGYVNIFDIKVYKNGFIVQYPSTEDPTQLGQFVENKKYLAALQEYNDIYQSMKISTIQDLNDKIADGKSQEVILASEALHEKKLAEIANKIAKNPDIKMILIAGPSSSGKTTFARRLGMQLRVNGIKPVTIGTDNYFVEREDTPRDENGDYDFETIDALDLPLFNEHLKKLIKGETIEMPEFDFKVGTKRYEGKNILKLEKDEILVIEGIHCLNDKLTSKIPKDQKFKIYISDLTVLNIDNYNRISTTDTRLIRRIVRDYNYRGYSALDTLKRWPSVHRGELKNIYPFQGEADAMFNSSLVYELAVLARQALPLLKEIKNDVPEYSEAKRLSSFLEYFAPIEDEDSIPNNSLIREFIGGSVFDAH